MLDDPEPDVRAAAALALLSFDPDAVTDAQWRQVLEQPGLDPSATAEVRRHLTRRTPPPGPPLRELWIQGLADADAPGQAAAATALAPLAEPAALEPLLELASDAEAEAAPRLAAAEALATYDDASLLERLTPLLERSPLDRLVAARALAGAGPAAVEPLRSLISTSDAQPLTLAAALRSLGRLDPAAVFDLRTAVPDPDSAARLHLARAAADVLERQPSDAAIDYLSEALNTPSADVQQVAREALVAAY